MLKDNRIVKSYSESFKLQVISELETGALSKNALVKKYDISYPSLHNWIKKYGKLELLNKRVKIQTLEETDKIKKLEEEIRQLKELLVQKDIKGYLDEAYLEYAAKQLGFKSVEELKKKLKLK